MYKCHKCRIKIFAARNWNAVECCFTFVLISPAEREQLKNWMGNSSSRLMLSCSVLMANYDIAIFSNSCMFSDNLVQNFTMKYPSILDLHVGHVCGGTQKNILSVLLWAPAVVGEQHCLVISERLVASQEFPVIFDKYYKN